VLVLRLTQSTVSGGRDGVRRVEAALEEDGWRQTAVSEFAFAVPAEDAERVRWYLEDYLEHPFDPAPRIADGVQARLRELGIELFSQVFGSGDGRDLWATLRARLPQTRVEIAADVGDATAWAWELLRDPRTDQPVALQARSFVHVNHGPAQPMRRPEVSHEALRVLLVICRPDREADVPFRSVAGQLVRLGTAGTDVLRLDVLRPPTFSRLAEVLDAAARAGRPYQVVHFDGHGTYADAATEGLATVAPARPGRHGYLIFERPGEAGNSQLVDGPSLGALLARSGVGVLVLNACRSAYAEAPAEPRQDAETADAHARVRAYGSLAQEVVDAGVPGVVAMRYSVYVVTAARFIADLYAALVAGQPLGEAVTAGRRQLHAEPRRQVAFEPMPLQDWPVPVVFEAAPLPLFTPRDRPVITITAPAEAANGPAGLPPPPDIGFLGRDETLLALDRAFDRHPAVLLHAYAGAGKTTTAAEFARWYAATGGLPGGTVLFSSFERHLPVERLLDQIGVAFAPLLEANRVPWLTLDDARRRDVAIQVLRQVPVLWVWDNVEPVAGFPAAAESTAATAAAAESTAAESAWSAAERGALVDLLRDLAGTRARVLLTSRRDERGWLGDLVARVTLPPMPMLERFQLAQALADRRGHTLTDLEHWRPLLRYTDGNPLAVTVLVGQALRDGLTGRDRIEAFVARLRAGEAGLDDDAAQGRGRSLGASLSYGFAAAFDSADRARLAALHLFQETVDADVLRWMGHPDNPSRVSTLDIERDEAVALLDRAADVGLLTDLGGGYYRIHPALPWYFTVLFDATYADREPVTRAYTYAMATAARFYKNLHNEGQAAVVNTVAAEEANLLHARDVARRHGWWSDVMGCMQGLRILYEPAGRLAEWSRLVDELAPDLVDPATGGPKPGHADRWHLLTEYRVNLAIAQRQYGDAEAVAQERTRYARWRAAEALAADPAGLDEQQQVAIHNLSVSLVQLGQLLQQQNRPDCLEPFREALAICRRARLRRDEAIVTQALGTALRQTASQAALEEARRRQEEALELIADTDPIGRANALSELGQLTLIQMVAAQLRGVPVAALAGLLDEAGEKFAAALALIPPEALPARRTVLLRIGQVYSMAGALDLARQHFEDAIRLSEASGDRYNAGGSRLNLAIALAQGNRVGDALLYARAALADFEATGSADELAATAGELITSLERRRASP
jgi:tetratricopeptide (TPR) repeat protein